MPPFLGPSREKPWKLALLVSALVLVGLGGLSWSYSGSDFWHLTIADLLTSAVVIVMGTVVTAGLSNSSRKSERSLDLSLKIVERFEERCESLDIHSKAYMAQPGVCDSPKVLASFKSASTTLDLLGKMDSDANFMTPEHKHFEELKDCLNAVKNIVTDGSFAAESPKPYSQDTIAQYEAAFCLLIKSILNYKMELISKPML